MVLSHYLATLLALKQLEVCSLPAFDRSINFQAKRLDWACSFAKQNRNNSNSHTKTPTKRKDCRTKERAGNLRGGVLLVGGAVFQRLLGVLSTQVGYTQGHKANPTYQEVCSGQTGHAEAVLLEYDPEEVSYEELLEEFWKKHDPITLNRQTDDMALSTARASTTTTRQKEAAKRTKKIVEKQLRTKVVTEILPTIEFWPAEDYHQRYLEKGGQCATKGCTDTIRCYG